MKRIRTVIEQFGIKLLLAMGITLFLLTYNPIRARSQCVTSIGSNSLGFLATGGTKSVTITSPVGCFYDVNTSEPWISALIKSKSLSVTCTANSGVERTGQITVDYIYTINIYQAGSCITSSPASSINPSANNICRGNAVSLSVNGGFLGTGATWVWYSGSCGGTYVGSGTSISVNPPATTTYYVRAESNCNTTVCASSTVSYYQPPTTATIATTPLNYCGTLTSNTLGGSTPAVGTGTWSKISGPGTVTFSNVNSGSSTATVSAYGTYLFSWTISNGTCSPSIANVSVTYYQTPTTAAITTTPLNHCGVLVSNALGGNAPAAGTGVWSKISGPGTVTFSNPSSGSSTATVSAYGTYVLRWTISNGTCASRAADVTVSYNQTPAATAGGPNSVCQSATPSAIALSGASIGGSATTGAWAIVSGGGTLSSTNHTATPSTVTYTPAASYSGTVTLRLTSSYPAGCAAATSTRTITVNALPLAAIGFDRSTITCPNPSAVLTASGGSSYLWSTGATSAAITVSPSANTTYSVIATSSSGCTASANQLIVVDKIPQPAAPINGLSVINPGTNGIDYSVPAISGATGYVWTLPPGVSIVSGANTNSIKVNVPTSPFYGNISVYGVNSCGNGNPANLTIQVLDLDLQTNKQVYTGTFTVGGDMNTYYPVVFKNGDQDKVNQIKIYRSFSEAGPNELSPTHKGGLTLEIDANYGGWGGSTYDWRIMDLRQTYHETFAGAALAMHNIGFIAWLRGGGFIYHYESNKEASIQVAYSTSELIYDYPDPDFPNYDEYAPSPKTTPDLTSIDLHRTGFWKGYNGKVGYSVGKIGIGTPSPIYQLSVKGVVGASDMVIEDYNDWPDYVFQPSYTLRSLHDLEQFIKANGHLPEIPSENEATTNGIELGVMNAKLLQKVEELTLYIIEQDKKISKQRSKMDIQGSQLFELKKNLLRIKRIETELNSLKK